MLRGNRKYLLAEILIVAVLLAVLAIPLMHVLRQARWQMRERQEVICFNNQKQIAYAALLWAQEHSDTLPPAATCWRELALPKEVLRCPAARFQRYGYVYSTRVAGKALSDIPDPVVSLLTGEGKSEDHLAHTATDFVPRHSRFMVASYADGHVSLVAPAGYQF